MRGRLERAELASTTYPDVGAAVQGRVPAGYDRLYTRSAIGAADAFDAARVALLGWAPQRAAHVTVYPHDAIPTVGTTVLLGLGLGPMRITAPCRVVWAVDEPDRAGFAYGTLPGHPERGEEAFVLDRDAAATWFTISGFSRPATLYARLGRPVTRLVQRRILAAYARALPVTAGS